MVEQISYSQLSSLGDYQLVDVRTQEERDEFHIGGIHLPNLNSLEELDPTLPIVVYCHSGRRSLDAAHIIQTRLHAKRVYSLEGGIQDLDGSHP